MPRAGPAKSQQTIPTRGESAPRCTEEQAGRSGGKLGRGGHFKVPDLHPPADSIGKGRRTPPRKPRRQRGGGGGHSAYERSWCLQGSPTLLEEMASRAPEILAKAKDFAATKESTSSMGQLSLLVRAYSSFIQARSINFQSYGKVSFSLSRFAATSFYELHKPALLGC